MNTMDNQKLIDTVKEQTLHKYLDKLIHAKIHKLTLFGVFPHTGAANRSDPHYVVMIDDVSKIAALNSGKFFN